MFNCAHLIVQTLRSYGVDLIFSLPGGHNLPIYDALIDYDDIHEVSARHEQGAGFMAVGYAYAKGRPAVILTTAGPGITNIITPVAHAYLESLPLLVLAINNYSHQIDSESGLFHELTDVRSLFAGCTASYSRAVAPADLVNQISRALEHSRFHRPRPIAVEIPSDLLSREATETTVRSPSVFGIDSVGDHTVDAAIALIESAKAPLIYCGGGCISSGAAGEMVKLAETIGAPVVTSVKGRGAISDSHPLAIGCVWDRIRSLDSLALEFDLLIAVGISFSKLSTREGKLPLPAKLLHIDIDAGVIGRTYPTTLGVIGDAKGILATILSRLDHLTRDEKTTTRVKEITRQWQLDFQENVPEAEKLLSDIRREVPEDAIVVCDMNVPAYWAMRFFEIYHPRTLLSAYYFGTLGFSIPAALGAKMACPDKCVVAFCGDGGFLFNSQELATAVQYGISVVVLLFNDNAYTAVKAAQKQLYGRTHAAFNLQNPDFVGLAKSYGWQGERVSTSQVGDAVRRAIGNKLPTVIEVDMPDPLPMPNDVRW